MITYLVRQDLAQRFSGNTLGLAWALVLPVLQLALFAVVFVFIFKARIPGLDGAGYVVYLSLGMWPWFAFSDAVGRGTTTFTDQAGLLSKVAIAPWHLVAARVLAGFALHGAGFLLVLLLLWLLTPHVSPQFLPFTLLAWAALLAIAFGAAICLAIVNVFFRDLQQMVTYGLTAAMFLTPILYSAQMGPPAMLTWQQWNPFAATIAGIRDPLMSQSIATALPLTALALALLLLLLARWLYARYRPHVVDFL